MSTRPDTPPAPDGRPAAAPGSPAGPDLYAGMDERPLHAPPVDAVLLVSFGGPEGPEDVLPFMENVTRGRGIPRERLEEVSRHYLDVFGGVSPINEQCRRLKAALEAELAARGPALPVYWGNRNWDPYLVDALRQMRDDGVQHALALVTSSFPSYSGCRQYREDWTRARIEVGTGAPLVTKVRHHWAEDGFLDVMAENLRATDPGEGAVLLFTAHSIPTAMADSSGPDGGAYVAALQQAREEVVRRSGLPHRSELVFQSRSGDPRTPWLEPDVGDRIEELHGEGVREVVMVPIGFTSDHVEVVYDLDTQAQERVAGLEGMRAKRAATVGTAPGYVAMLRDLLVERLEAPAELPSHGAVATHDRCPAHCCPAPRRPAARPADRAAGDGEPRGVPSGR